MYSVRFCTKMFCPLSALLKIICVCVAGSLISLLCPVVMLYFLVKGCCCVNDDSKLEKMLIRFLSRMFKEGVHVLLYVKLE